MWKIWANINPSSPSRGENNKYLSCHHQLENGTTFTPSGDPEIPNIQSFPRKVETRRRSPLPGGILKDPKKWWKYDEKGYKELLIYFFCFDSGDEFE